MKDFIRDLCLLLRTCIFDFWVGVIQLTLIIVILIVSASLTVLPLCLFFWYMLRIGGFI